MDFPSLAFATSIGPFSRGPPSRQASNVCSVRASATPTPPSSGDAVPNWDGKEKKLALEKMFSLDLPSMNPEGDGGKCSCIWCDGSGTRRCAWCQGKGTRMETMNLSWEQMTGEGSEDEPIELPEQVPVRFGNS